MEGSSVIADGDPDQRMPSGNGSPVNVAEVQASSVPLRVDVGHGNSVPDALLSTERFISSLPPLVQKALVISRSYRDQCFPEEAGSPTSSILDSPDFVLSDDGCRLQFPPNADARCVSQIALRIQQEALKRGAEVERLRGELAAQRDDHRETGRHAGLLAAGLEESVAMVLEAAKQMQAAEIHVPASPDSRAVPETPFSTMSSAPNTPLEVPSATLMQPISPNSGRAVTTPRPDAVFNAAVSPPTPSQLFAASPEKTSPPREPPADDLLRCLEAEIKELKAKQEELMQERAAAEAKAVAAERRADIAESARNAAETVERTTSELKEELERKLRGLEVAQRREAAAAVDAKATAAGAIAQLKQAALAMDAHNAGPAEAKSEVAAQVAECTKLDEFPKDMQARIAQADIARLNDECKRLGQERNVMAEALAQEKMRADGAATERGALQQQLKTMAMHNASLANDLAKADSDVTTGMMERARLVNEAGVHERNASQAKQSEEGVEREKTQLMQERAKASQEISYLTAEVNRLKAEVQAEAEKHIETETKLRLKTKEGDEIYKERTRFEVESISQSSQAAEMKQRMESAVAELGLVQARSQELTSEMVKLKEEKEEDARRVCHAPCLPESCCVAQASSSLLR
ncbi:hypothetical protein CYMTET_45547 [Cymbomonas tetramitiformis]|uniref:Uncharacterized protein n=1 Tax=Cymbomonas tetramitiformis TaxID=36881 RepID=A0AAE0BY12_9CHLO|nr:hypothetical protein CYMTET_45547 [Cymbomonas tetramitiformis]